MQNPRTLTDESGAILPLFALLIVVLLVFAALTVDLGAAWAERRHDQTAADAGALAAATQAATSGGITPQDLVDEVMEYVDLNLGRSIDQSAWESCIDDEHLLFTAASFPGVVPATECISIGTTDNVDNEIRVKLPNQVVPTSFAALIGIDSIPVTAFAQARFDWPTELSPPPFAVPSGFGAGQETCLRTNSTKFDLYEVMGNGPGVDAIWPDPADPDFDPHDPDLRRDPCWWDPDLPDASQFFNAFDAASYATCSGANLFEFNIASGIDHMLSSFEPDFGNPGQSAVVEEGCFGSNPRRFYPNTFTLGSGFDASALRCGLLSTKGDSPNANCQVGPPDPFGNKVDPRLKPGLTFPTSQVFAGESAESLALWDKRIFNPDPVSSPASCRELRKVANGDATAAGGAAANYDYYDRKDLMVQCLSQWHSADGPMFTDALLDSRRFAFVPYLDESNFNTSPIHFNAFVPVFLNTLYQDAPGSSVDPDDWPPFCVSPNGEWFVQESGEGSSCGSNNANVDRLSAIVLNCGMLPGDSCIPDGPPNNPSGQPRLTIELTR